MFTRIRRAIRRLQLRRLHSELSLADSEQEREEILNSWWLGGRITTGEDQSFSIRYGVRRRIEWFERNARINRSMKDKWNAKP